MEDDGVLRGGGGGGWSAPEPTAIDGSTILVSPLQESGKPGFSFEIQYSRVWITTQVLLRRPRRPACLPGPDPSASSLEDRAHAVRIDHLRQIRSLARFISFEPLLGPIGPVDLVGIAWVIVGGESGLGSRPMDPSWAMALRDRCREAGAAFFFKQWRGFRPKSGGRLLEGREWNELPGQAAACKASGT